MKCSTELTLSGQFDGIPFRISPARYAREMINIRLESKDGYKTRGGFVAKCLGGRWCPRDGGYLMSVKKGVVWLWLMKHGWDGCMFDKEFTHDNYGREKFIYRRGKLRNQSKEPGHKEIIIEIPADYGTVVN